jgi:ABC-type transport system involved in multi-copper enzyme maturation permease subunit
LFALIYLLGLLTLRLWPERVRSVGLSLFEQPVKSFVVGFLCWLLFVPVLVLLCISLVGILLVPLLPVALFLAVVMGLSGLALRVGEALPAGPGERFVPPAALGMGMLVLLILAFVPFLGIPLLALVQFFALGAAVGSRFGRALPAPRPT